MSDEQYTCATEGEEQPTFELSQNVRTSKHINQLACAMAMAQLGMEHPKHNRKNNRNSYADMVSVLDAIRNKMNEHGLTLMQFPGRVGSDVCVTTVIAHKSGQYVVSECVMPMPKGNTGGNEYQAFGIAVTYIRRYVTNAIAAVHGEPDDDAISLDGSQKPKASDRAEKEIEI